MDARATHCITDVIGVPGRLIIASKKVFLLPIVLLHAGIQRYHAAATRPCPASSPRQGIRGAGLLPDRRSPAWAGGAS